MTREKQIRKYAEEKCMRYDDIGFDDEAYTLIIETLEWADENPKEGLVSIDKACEWLGNRDIMEKILHYRTSLIDDYVKEFRKAMEE